MRGQTSAKAAGWNAGGAAIEINFRRGPHSSFSGSSARAAANLANKARRVSMTPSLEQ